MKPMLEGLDSIDWSSLQHAYGSAADVPSQLRRLLSDEEDERCEALDELFSNVWHQGTIYSASAFVVPFLRELIAAPQVKDKTQLIMLLASIAGGRGYYEVHEPDGQRFWRMDMLRKISKEKKAVAAVREAVADYVPELLNHLCHPEPEVRRAVAEALRFYPQHRAVSKAALEQARAGETDPEVLEVFNEALMSVPAAGGMPRTSGLG